MMNRIAKRVRRKIARRAPAGVFESLEPRQLFTAAPTGAFLQYVSGTGDSRTFAILYDGPTTIDRATLGRGDVRVSNGSGFVAFATFTGATRYKPGTGTVARYRVDGVTGGAYTLAIRSGAVADLAGEFVQSGTVGAFVVGRHGHTFPGTPRQALVPSVFVAGTTYGSATAPPPVGSNFGTVVKAINFGGPPYPLTSATGDMLSFESQLTTPAPAATPVTLSTITATLASPNPSDLADQTTGNNLIWESQTFTLSGDAETLTIDGLDPTRTYRLQFLHGDDRGGDFPYYPTPQTFSIPTGETTTTTLHFGSLSGDADSNTAVIVSGTTGLTYSMPPSESAGPSFSAVLIEVSPDVAPPRPTPLASAAFVRSSVRITGSAQTFKIAFGDPSSAITATRLAEQEVLVTGPGGFASRAKLIDVGDFGDGRGVVATYSVDGIAFTSRYTVSVLGTPIAQVTLFYLRPQWWE